MGRPPKKKAEKQDGHVMVNVTPAELRMLKAEAKAKGLSLGALLMLPWRNRE
jgi:hypothetical protein